MSKQPSETICAVIPENRLSLGYRFLPLTAVFALSCLLRHDNQMLQGSFQVTMLRPVPANVRVAAAIRCLEEKWNLNDGMREFPSLC